VYNSCFPHTRLFFSHLVILHLNTLTLLGSKHHGSSYAFPYLSVSFSFTYLLCILLWNSSKLCSSLTATNYFFTDKRLPGRLTIIQLNLKMGGNIIHTGLICLTGFDVHLFHTYIHTYTAALYLLHNCVESFSFLYSVKHVTSRKIFQTKVMHLNDMHTSSLTNLLSYKSFF
jgi:hypothetical protein